MDTLSFSLICRTMFAQRLSSAWIALLICGLLSSVSGCHPRKPKPPVFSVESSVKPTDPPKPTQSGPKTREQAIAAGIDYLSRCRWELDFVYLYSYLQSKNEWPRIPAQVANELIRDSLQRNGDERAMRIHAQMAMFDRLRDPSYILPREKMALAQEEDAFTVPALYCDAYPLDTAKYLPVLRQEMSYGDYRLSHALLALFWIEERNCIPATSLAPIRKQLIDGNHAIVDRFAEWNDLRLESAALLQAAGEPIPEEWIRQVISVQQPDGGWKEFPERDNSNTHSTILALWLLSGFGK